MNILPGFLQIQFKQNSLSCFWLTYQCSNNSIFCQKIPFLPFHSEDYIPVFRELVPRDPWSEAGGQPEVRVNFEAVMLDVSRERESRMWIHVTTRACRDEAACKVSCQNQNLCSESRYYFNF